MYIAGLFLLTPKYDALYIPSYFYVLYCSGAAKSFTFECIRMGFMSLVSKRNKKAAKMLAKERAGVSVVVVGVVDDDNG